MMREGKRISRYGNKKYAVEFINKRKTDKPVYSLMPNAQSIKNETIHNVYDQ